MKIKLFCAAGVSTSLLVARMRVAAKEQNLDVEIDSYGLGFLDEEIRDADVLLLGPQVGYKEKEIKQLAENFNVGFGVIPIKEYAMVNGKGTLDFALNLKK